jgi:serine/threonine protein kinase/tetratricopeptide (TPR) repeat protein/TolB-like protein
MIDSWARTKELFSLALEREPDARHAFLQEICGTDETLRLELESLLASHERAGNFLENAAAEPWHPTPAANMIGRIVGDYRVIREAGRGGTSIVYLAERADQQYQKRVAIKILRSAGESIDIIQRFRTERQTLAELNHPNIVTLLDGGTTNEGLPYLVMDFVEGMPIDRYCDTHHLPIGERLRMFRIVCEAVEHAHRNGVIHRDLKPSNILVTSESVPRLLDFGIAKLCDPKRFALDTMVTLIGTRAMTPEYASPEQVRGQPVTVATDLYSMGVLLYVLLCGHHPFRIKDSSLFDLEKMICEQAPVRPSVAVKRIDDNGRGDDDSTPLTPQSVAVHRALRPAALVRELRGDLDAIATKALSKEPQRRYLSAIEFSDDIGSYLAGMPVGARRSRVLYRAEKFIARHRESLAVALIILTVGSGAAAWQLQRVRAASSVAATTAPVAVRRSIAVLGFWNLSQRDDTAWLATALSEMLTTDLAAGGKLRLLPGDTIARAKIELSLPDVASLSGSALDAVRRDLGSDYVVSGSYLDLGTAAGGRIRLDLHLQDAATGEMLTSVSEQGSEAQLFDIVSRTGARLRERLGVSDVAAAESAGVQVSMPSSTEAAKLYSEGLDQLRAFDALAARDLLWQAEVAEPAFPLTHAALAKVWLALGYDANARQEAKTAMDTAGKLSRENQLLAAGEYYEAIKDWEPSIEAYRTLFNFFPDNPEYGLALSNAQIAAGRGKDAVITLQKLRRVSREADWDPRIDLAEAKAAGLESDNSRQASAATSAAQKAQRSGAKLLVAAARVVQCRAWANLGDKEQSTPACEEALAIYENAKDWAGAARALHNMAELPLNQGNLQLAQSLYERALAMARRTGDGRGIARELGNLGVVFDEQGQLEQAEQFARESLAGYEEIGYALGVAGQSENVAGIFHSQGRLHDAMQQYQDSLARARTIGNADLEALDLAAKGDVLVDQGDLSAAAQQYDQALTLQRRIGEKSYYAKTLVALGRLKAQQGNAAAARSLYSQALSIQRQLGEKGSLAQTQIAQAESMCDADQPSDAASLARRALQEFQLENKRSDEIRARAVLARALLRQGQVSAARESIDAALPLAERGSVINRLALQLDDARVRAAEQDEPGAERTARQVLSATQAQGLVSLQLEASLALAEIVATGTGATSAASASAELARLQDTARSRGFALIAHKAAQLAARPVAVSVNGT